MAGRRPSAQRMSELRGCTPQPRVSRIDQGKKSFIPRAVSGSNISLSADRMSGVRPLDDPSSIKRQTGTGAYARNRSAETHRQKLWADSAQRPSAKVQYRSRSTLNLETPRDSRAMKTPMSSSSTHGHRMTMQSGNRTPSNERHRPFYWDQALSAVPMKDNRPISDTNWQKMTAAKILSYLREEQNFTLPPGPAPLKPITIRTFLDIVNHLLYKFGGARFLVDNNNYLDKLPELAKKFHYPGVMTKSWLKSVNAMHTYPQMLAFISYLVELAKYIDAIEESMTVEKLYGGDGRLILRHRHTFEVWKLWNFQMVDNFEEATNKYIEDLKELLGVQDELFNEGKRDLNDLDKKKRSCERDMEELQEQKDQLFDEWTRLRNMNENRNKDISRYIQSREDKEVILMNKKNKLKLFKEKNKSLQKQVEDLQKQISQQKMSVKERNEHLEDIDKNNGVIMCLEQHELQMEKAMYEKDLELAKKQKKTFDSCVSINQKIFSTGLDVGLSFTNFTIPERGLLAPGAIDTITSACAEVTDLIARTRSDLKKDKEQKLTCEDIERQMVKVNSSIQMLERKISGIQEEINDNKTRSAKVHIDRDESLSKVQMALELKNQARRALERSMEELSRCENATLRDKLKLEELQNEEAGIHEHWKKIVRRVMKEVLIISDEYVNAVH